MRSFASMDWGFNSPGDVLWWLVLPDGHYHIWREWKFQGLGSVKVAEGIAERTAEYGLKLSYLVGDPAMWQHTGAGEHGEAIAETMQRTFGRLRAKIVLRKGDHERINGWQRVHDLLQTAPDGRPWLTVEDEPHCRYLRRSMASALCDKTDADDIDTKSDDHALDTLRYGAMSRPPIGQVVQTARSVPWSLGWLKAQGAGMSGVLSPRRVRLG